ncbi:hypothetical protein Tco_0516683 [Tanacetum coccineum]
MHLHDDTIKVKGSTIAKQQILLVKEDEITKRGILLCEKTKLAKALIVALFFDKTSVVVANRDTIQTLQNSSATMIQITRDAEADPYSTNSQGGGGAGRYLSMSKDGGGDEYVTYTVHIPPTPDHQFMANSQDSLKYGNVNGCDQKLVDKSSKTKCECRFRICVGFYLDFCSKGLGFCPGCKDPFRENCYESDNEDEFQPMMSEEKDTMNP